MFYCTGISTCMISFDIHLREVNFSIFFLHFLQRKILFDKCEFKKKKKTVTIKYFSLQK